MLTVKSKSVLEMSCVRLKVLQSSRSFRIHYRILSRAMQWRAVGLSAHASSLTRSELSQRNRCDKLLSAAAMRDARPIERSLSASLTANHHLEIANAVHVAMQAISCFGRADTRRCAGEDEIAGGQLEQTR